MTALEILILFLVPMLAGVLATGCWSWVRKSPLEAIAISWILGVLIVGCVTWLVLECGLGPRASIIGVGSLLVGLSFRWVARDAFHVATGDHGVRSWCTAVSALGVVLLVVAMVAKNSFPMIDGDESSIFSGVAQSAYISEGFGPRFLERVDRDEDGLTRLIHHPDYPPLNAMLQVWSYSVHEGILWFESRWILQLTTLMGYLVLCAALLRTGSSWMTALIMLAVATHPEFRTAAVEGGSDGILGTGYIIAIAGLCGSLSIRPRTLVTLGLTCAVLSKHEGTLFFALCGTAWIVLSLLRGREHDPLSTRIRSGVLPLVVPGLALLGVWLHNAAHALSNDLLTPPPVPANLAVASEPRLTYLLEAFGRLATGPTGLFLLIGLIVAVIRCWPIAWNGYCAATVVLIAMLCGVFAVFLRTPFPIIWHWETAGPRVVSHLVLPLALLIGSRSTGLTRNPP